MEPLNLPRIAAQLQPPRDVHKLLDAPFANARLIRVAPGGDIPPHYEPYDVFFYIVSGTGIIQVGEQRHQVVPGDFLHSPKTLVRGISPETPLVLLGIQEVH
jgi:quercetin dioxygenase-like cupin family protein